MWKELCVESVLQLRQSLLLILVSMITKVDIENFIEVPIHLPSDGSLIQILLTSHNLEIDQLILYFLTNHDYSLMISFINRIQHYPEAIPAFIQAPGFLEILKLVSLSHNSQLITTILSIFSDSEIITTIPSIYIEGLTKYCVQWTSHDNIALSNSSSSILSKLAILNLKSCDEVIEGIMEYLHQPLDTTVRMRYLGIVSEIMATGKEEWFAICLRRGATDEVLKACEIPDILAQMVALEYLPSVMSCQIGLDYLTTAVVLNRSPPVSHLDWLLEASTERGDDYVRAQCLSCAAVLLSNLEKTDHSFCQKTVASVCHYTTVTIPSFLSSLCNLLESYVETEKLIALSSLSLFATSSPSAFLSTLSFPDLLSTWLQLLRSQPSLQAPTLHSIAQVLLYPYVLNMNQPLHPNSDVPMRTALQPSHLKERVSASFVNHLVRRNQGSQEAILSCLTSFDSLKKNLFHQIGTSVGKSSTMEFLVKLAKQPIAETKLGAVDVLRSLAYQDNIWGLQTLMGNVGFYQYLQDRTTEFSIEGKDWKFSLIWAVYCSPSSDLLSTDVLKVLQHMLFQGPYYMPPRLEEPLTEEKGSS